LIEENIWWKLNDVATTVLFFNDVPMEIVSALLGHATMSVGQESYSQL
jgi:hypothetical protein